MMKMLLVAAAAQKVIPKTPDKAYGGDYYIGEIVGGGSTYAVIVCPLTSETNNLVWNSASNTTGADQRDRWARQQRLSSMWQRERQARSTIVRADRWRVHRLVSAGSR
jgi:hypothetical protein